MPCFKVTVRRVRLEVKPLAANGKEFLSLTKQQITEWREGVKEKYPSLRQFKQQDVCTVARNNPETKVLFDPKNGYWSSGLGMKNEDPLPAFIEARKNDPSYDCDKFYDELGELYRSYSPSTVVRRGANKGQERTNSTFPKKECPHWFEFYRTGVTWHKMYVMTFFPDVTARTDEGIDRYTGSGKGAFEEVADCEDKEPDGNEPCTWLKGAAPNSKASTLSTLWHSLTTPRTGAKRKSEEREREERELEEREERERQRQRRLRSIDRRARRAAVRRKTADAAEAVAETQSVEAHNTVYLFAVDAATPGAVTHCVQRTIDHGWHDEFRGRTVVKMGVTAKSEPTQREKDCNSKFAVTHSIDRYVKLGDFVKEDVEKLTFKNLEDAGFKLAFFIGFGEASQEHFYLDHDETTGHEEAMALARRVFGITVSDYLVEDGEEQSES